MSLTAKGSGTVFHKRKEELCLLACARKGVGRGSRAGGREEERHTETESQRDMGRDGGDTGVKET